MVPSRHACAIFVATLVTAGRAEAASNNDPDPWFGRDKALHFSATALIAGGTYVLGATQFRARYPALLLGAGAGIGVGAAKEIADELGYGDPSWRDFTWDVIGTLAGLGVAWSLDLLIRGASHEHPAFAAPASTMSAHGFVLRW